ncbi:elongation factor 4 [bacterium (Candidatus Howlettbacteria) CG_4_10_14_0_8_um_filter_40_9]|nr:MAG: elongation factor 4 [bacterium (Candidatus Howlettbacteria) CG_4_10_14_0_8_um_filter_40_9]
MQQDNTEFIRNFVIISHVDHGKSTLADRFLELTHTVEKRDMKEQLLDTMDLERERGITIKLQPVRMEYTPQFPINNIQYPIKPKEGNPRQQSKSLEIGNCNLDIKDSKSFILNLIDTPGHVDFSYEVSRSLAAVEGAVLLVDASQGIEAQTLSNIYMALEHDLEIIPVINKIDLPQAEPDRVANEMVEILGIKKEEIIFVSGKTGEGVSEVLNRVIEKVPAPRVSVKDYPRALIFDSFFDTYRGVITYSRVFDGEFKKGDEIEMLATGRKAEILEIGHMKPKLTPTDALHTGEVGYMVTGLKNVSEASVGDTITTKSKNQNKEALPGYKKVTPFVFAGLFTTSNDNYTRLKEALEKLTLSDSSLAYEPESSQALGFGFRCGFLGLLHLEIIKERLEREFDLDLIVTSPSVTYDIVLNNDNVATVKNPSEIPDATQIKEIREPWLKIEVVTPTDYLGGIIKLVQERRGIQKGMQYLDEKRVVLTYEIPMASIITDFYDDLKSISSGYASMNYEILDFRTEDLVRIDILIAGNRVDSLSQIVHRSESYKSGLRIVEKLKDNIPKQMFKITLQAAIGAKILARKDIQAMRKDVTAKLYGGDVTRKNKLLDKQKKGKKKMKMIGSVEIPTKVFLELLKK